MAKAPATRAAKAAVPVDRGERRGHLVLSSLKHDGTAFEPEGDEPAYVTEAEFDVLKAAKVFDGEWRDGQLEAGDGEG